MNIPAKLDNPMFSITDAARFTQMTSSRVRRWLKGYTYHYDHRTFRQEPIVGQKATNDGPYASFLELIDLLFVKRFLDAGVSLQHLRKALDEASRILGTVHFARQNFFTDGREVYLEMKDEGDAILHLLKNGQWAIPDIIRHLADRIEFDAFSGYAKRWFPLGEGGLIVIDPTISFGRPAVVGQGVATAAIYDFYIAERRRTHLVTNWFKISQEEVMAAVRFEEQFIA